MLILATVSLPFMSLAISSSAGAIILHGPHHSAQKSTSTGPLAFRTSDSNDASLTCVVLAGSVLAWVVVFIPVFLLLCRLHPGWCSGADAAPQPLAENSRVESRDWYRAVKATDWSHAQPTWPCRSPSGADRRSIAGNGEFPFSYKGLPGRGDRRPTAADIAAIHALA